MGSRVKQRAKRVYVLASAFNDFGVNKTLAEYIMSNFELSEDFTQEEIKRTIHSGVCSCRTLAVSTTRMRRS